MDKIKTASGELTEIEKVFEFKFKNMIQSSRLNFLIGAGCSSPYLGLLDSIEEKIKGGSEKAIEAKRDYFSKVMSPCLDIFNDGNLLEVQRKNEYETVKQNYEVFFEVINSLLITRRIDILNKQVNIFTTNIDVFMEHMLETSKLEYNDGFRGTINPKFNIANFNKSVKQSSLHFSYDSEIPSFNIVKLHGSLNWEKIGDTITHSRLSIIEDMKKHLDDDAPNTFDRLYGKLQILNLDNRKDDDTVSDYYELLRMYSGCLERESSLLFIIGFSMGDKHIKKITIRAANSNPTLQIFFFCYKKVDEAKYIKLFGKVRHNNIKIIAPTKDREYDIKTITECFFRKLLNTKKSYSKQK